MMGDAASSLSALAQPLVSVHDGLRNLQITEAIAEAARTGAAVETPVA